MTDKLQRNDTIFVVLGNQLFPLKHSREHDDAAFFMAEDHGLCV